MKIKGFIRSSFIDWDGKITSVLFLPQCNLRCPMCHNYGLFLHPEEYDDVPLQQIDEYLNKHKDFIDGVVLTGGEPTLHKDLEDLIRHFRQMGLAVKLDTNGYNPQVLETLLNADLVDYIAMDIKAPLTKEKYEQSTGISIDLTKIKQSIDLIKESGVDYEFRMTVIPSFHTMDDIKQVAQDISGVKRFVIQQFNPENTLDESLHNVEPYERAQLDEFAQQLDDEIEEVKIRA